MSWNGGFFAQPQRGSSRGRPGRGNYRGGTRGGSSRGGQWRDNRNSRGNFQASWRDRPDTGAAQLPALPCGPLIESLRAADLDGEAASFEDAAFIRDVEAVTSFSWMDGKTPTILVPGMPPRWTPPTSAADSPPPQLSPDAGIYLRDVNAAGFPAHPMEPTVVASLAADPSLPRSVDVVACGSTLGNLLRFLRGDDKPFRMLAEIVKGTLFLVRRERSPTDRIDNVYGYGHAFPEAYTTWDSAVRGSTSHQRVLRYSFGHLDLVVRFEVDGYLEAEGENEEREEREKRDKREEREKREKREDDKPTTGSSSSTVDDLVAGLGGLTTTASNSAGNALPSSSSSSSSASSPVLTVRHSGSPVVDRSRVFDIKTRSDRKRDIEDTVALEMPRLWVRQIDNFVLAYHSRGTFHDVQVMSVRDRVRAWERHPEQRPALRRLAALLHRLVEAARAAPDQRLEVVYAGGGGEGGGEGGGGGGGGDGRPVTGVASSSGWQSRSEEGAPQPQLELHEQLPGTESTLSSAVGELWNHGLGLSAGSVSPVSSPASAVSDRGPRSSDQQTQEEPRTTTPVAEDGKTDRNELPSLADLIAWDDDKEDYTGCSAACGYCGECTY